jgi:tetratricopeptide (TPR) repeat protein
MILKKYLLKCGLLGIILNVSWGAEGLPSFDSRYPGSGGIKIPIASGEPAEPCIVGPDVLENEAGASSMRGVGSPEVDEFGERVVARLLLLISDSKEAAAVRAVLEDLSALNRRGVRDFAIKGFCSVFKSDGIASSDRLIAAKALFELEAYDEGIAAFEELLYKDGRAILEAKALAERIEAFLCFDSWSFRENEAQEKAFKKLKKYYNGFEVYVISQDEKEAAKKAVSRLVERLEDVAQQNMSIKKVAMWFDSVKADMDLLSGLGSGVFLH